MWVDSVEMVLENGVPSVHSVDLVLVVLLAGAGGHVSLGPLSVASGDLPDADSGVGSIVAELVLFLWLWTAVWQGRVVEAASLLAAEEVLLHSTSVGGEFGDPPFLRGESGKPLGQDLFRKLSEPVESLQRVARRNLAALFFLSSGEAEEKERSREFHRFSKK